MRIGYLGHQLSRSFTWLMPQLTSHPKKKLPSESSQSTELWQIITNHTFKPPIMRVVYYSVKDRTGIHWLSLTHSTIHESWECALASSLLLLRKALEKKKWNDQKAAMKRRGSIGPGTLILGITTLCDGVQWPIFRKGVVQLYSAFAFGGEAPDLSVHAPVNWGPLCCPCATGGFCFSVCPGMGWYCRPPATSASKKDLSCGSYAWLPCLQLVYQPRIAERC